MSTVLQRPPTHEAEHLGRVPHATAIGPHLPIVAGVRETASLLPINRRLKANNAVLCGDSRSENTADESESRVGLVENLIIGLKTRLLGSFWGQKHPSQSARSAFSCIHDS